MIKNKFKISVIIPTYNSWETLKDCIISIEKQTLKPHEIIVVDNGSTDTTEKEVKKLSKLTKLIRYFKNRKNLGVTGGRNRGIKQADKNSDYLLFFDHDMVADKNMIEELVKVLEKNAKWGVATAKIYYWDKKDEIWAAGTGINLWTGKNWFRNGKDTGQFEDITEVPIAPAVIFTKREVINKVGGFDDTFFAVYEDTDFCFRVRSEGFKVCYTPKAIAYHKIPFDDKDSKKRLATRLYWIGRNRTIFMKRYGKNMLIYLVIAPVFFAYYGFLALRYGKPENVIDYVKGFFIGLSS